MSCARWGGRLYMAALKIPMTYSTRFACVVNYIFLCPDLITLWKIAIVGGWYPFSMMNTVIICGTTGKNIRPIDAYIRTANAQVRARSLIRALAVQGILYM